MRAFCPSGTNYCRPTLPHLPYAGEMGRPFVHHRPLSPFGRYVVALCEAASKSPSHLLAVFGSKMRMSYALRSRVVGERSRASLLSYEELCALAHALRANRAQSHRLILLGLLEHAPERLRSYVIKLTKQNGELGEALGRPPPPVDFAQGSLDLDPP